MTHRKYIITALLLIAAINGLLISFALLNPNIKETILMALVGVSSNIVSLLGGIYIGRGKTEGEPK